MSLKRKSRRGLPAFAEQPQYSCFVTLLRNDSKGSAIVEEQVLIEHADKVGQLLSCLGPTAEDLRVFDLQHELLPQVDWSIRLHLDEPVF